ncbi:MAG: YdcF family protein [Desulfobacterales bacterium]|nr:YdcF family protein [Desulfobacterales bacterium]
MAGIRRTLFHLVTLVLIALMLVALFFGRILTEAGEFLVLDEEPVHAGAVVVLYTGTEWYPRLMEAAALYREGLADKVVINGNRKTKILRRLEEMGFQSCCAWHENALRILALQGVPREAVITVNAEDVYDTVTEARVVGDALIEAGISDIIITTSKYHIRRARYIWKHTHPKQFNICTVAARNDPFSPKGWWKDGRQIRWVMTEYGAWIYYLWKTLAMIED